MSAKKCTAKGKQPKTIMVGKPQDQQGRLKDIGGSKSDDWNNVIANQVAQTLWVANSNEAESETQYQAAFFGLMGIGPKDELEGMMAAQLVASHNAAMECYRRAMIGEQTFEGRKENLNQANKLSRTWAALLDALNKHRGKGQQKVTVEHVHVHSGGHAVVGTVEHPGGGARQKNEGQGHAKQVAHASQREVRRTDEARDPVPVTGDGERPLPDARRQVDRRAEG
jgi:hypothetical protein